VVDEAKRQSSGRIEEPDGGQKPGTTSSPLSHGFLVEFAPDSKAGDRLFRGKVEHIISGISAEFDSSDDLCSFFLRVLEQIARGG